ncbi:hypothetical protein RZE82_01720 [Mollicutes bacterium LVI A0039]|nr:hypothetical protein RZE82_01720 [Mollicutes bacterium LVI A0039]
MWKLYTCINLLVVYLIGVLLPIAFKIGTIMGFFIIQCVFLVALIIEKILERKYQFSVALLSKDIFQYSLIVVFVGWIISFQANIDAIDNQLLNQMFVSTLVVHGLALAIISAMSYKRNHSASQK